jgi:hypothetical protein
MSDGEEWMRYDVYRCLELHAGVRLFHPTAVEKNRNEAAG